MYYTFIVNGKEYKLKLSIRAIITLERQLGVNPLLIFGNGDTMPTITVMIQILHASLQRYQHNISYEDAEQLFEEWLEDGHIITDFLQVLIGIYRVSGLIKEENEKN